MIYVTDYLRIRKFDDLNLVIEQLEEVKSKEGKISKKWKFVGYFQNVRVALQAILNRDMLIDVEDIKNLSAYSTALEKQIKAIERIIKQK